MPGFATRAIHVGQTPDPATGAVVVPIYQTSTFVQDDVGRHRGYEYSRTANPTRSALERCLADLEAADDCAAFASGMAAADAVLRLLRPGDELIVGSDLYGGTWRLATRVYAPLGVTVTAVDLTDLDAVRAALGPRTRMVWAESPSNPLLRIVDLAALAELTHAHGALLVVDNTFATPYLQRPLELGADIVVHSTTKYLGGHSDVVGGAVCTRGEWGEAIRFLQNAAGAVAGPFDAWLVLRGIRTLAVRMEAHCRNAERVARFLAGHPAVVRVHYPGLEDHPGHAIAARQMSGFGGMVSFEVADAATARRVATGTRLFALAESLGGVESLIEVPAAMTHASVAGSPAAVPDRLIRLSVGIEDPDDLTADLGAALEAAVR